MVHELIALCHVDTVKTQSENKANDQSLSHLVQVIAQVF